MILGLLSLEGDKSKITLETSPGTDFRLGGRHSGLGRHVLLPRVDQEDGAQERGGEKCGTPDERDVVTVYQRRRRQLSDSENGLQCSQGSRGTCFLFTNRPNLF